VVVGENLEEVEVGGAVVAPVVWPADSGFLLFRSGEVPGEAANVGTGTSVEMDMWDWDLDWD
jgi:hypothetical protein